MRLIVRTPSSQRNVSSTCAYGHTSFAEHAIPEDLVARSSILQQAVASAGDADEVTLMLPNVEQQCIDSWLKTCNEFEQKWTSNELVSGLQAADFLADESAVQRLCPLLAQKLLPDDGPAAPPGSLPHTHQGGVTVAIDGTVRSSYWDDHVSVLDCIRHLPPTHHRLVLEVKHPELADKKFALTCLYRGQSQRYLVEILHVLQTVALCFSDIRYLDLGTGIGSEEPAAREPLAARLASTLRTLTHLVTLKVSGCLVRTTVTVLAEALPFITSLQKFHALGLQDSLPVSGRGCFVDVINSLKCLPCLESLQVCGFRETTLESSSRFCSKLRQLHGLTSLHLRSCFHSTSSDNAVSPFHRLHVSSELASAIRALTNLKTLHIIECFEMDFIEPVLQAIGYQASLTHLNLSRLSHIPPSMMPVGVTAAFLEDLRFQKQLAPMLSRQTALRSLNLSGAWMWGGDNSLVGSLVGLTMLTQLSLSAFYRPCDFWENFGEQVSGLRNLIHLSVHDNGLLRREGTKLLQGLSMLPKLVHLSGDIEPLAQLYSHLRQMTGLTRLDLFGTDSAPSDDIHRLQKELKEKLGSMSQCVQIVKF